MPTWDSDQYVKFVDERTQPAYDLASRVRVTDPRKIVDIGCGPGNSTKVLCQQWPDANISAFDSSPEMLKQAKKTNLQVHWFESRVEDWEPAEVFDIIFSNAVLQWVENHSSLLPSLIQKLNPAGALALQMPAHYQLPLQQCLLEVSNLPKWNKQTQLAREQLSLQSPSFYFDLLDPITSNIDIWETQYFHILDSVEAILEWFRGTGLRPYLETLPDDDEKKAFESELLNRYKEAYPTQTNGKVLFPFNRFFLVCYA